MKSGAALKYVSFIIPLLFFIPIIYGLLQKPLTIYPWKQRVYRTDAYSDEGTASGRTASSIDSFKTTVNSITLEYTLRDGEEYPYAGMYFSTEIKHNFTDLSGYDYLKLKIAVSIRDIYQIKIKTQMDGHTVESDSNTRCPLEKALILEDFMKEYIIPLSEFEFLDWWFARQQLEPADYNKQKLLRKVAAINFQQTKKMAPGTEEKGRMIIKECSFHKSFTLLYILSGSGFLLSTMVLLLIFFRIQSKKSEHQGFSPLEYNPVNLTSYTDADTKRLAEFIMENYTDPDLSMKKLYAETGISRQRITALIKKKYNMTFKQLLNKIRLTEAARLLEETDRNITDIATALGFSGSSYFFQVFKSEYNISPTDYRKRNSKGI